MYKLNKIIDNVEQAKEESPKKGHKANKIRGEIGGDLAILKIYMIDIREYCCRCVGILK